MAGEFFLIRALAIGFRMGNRAFEIVAISGRGNRFGNIRFDVLPVFVFALHGLNACNDERSVLHFRGG